MVQDVDFKLLAEMQLLPMDLLQWIDKDQLVDNSGFIHGFAFFGRNAMVGKDYIRVSVGKDEWNKWADSEDRWYDFTKPEDYQDFILWVQEQKVK